MEICRLCLYKGDNTKLSSIFDNEYNNFAVKIDECISLKIFPNDNLPLSICTACVNQINQWDLFKECAHKSHQILLQSYQESIYNEQYISHDVENEIEFKSQAQTNATKEVAKQLISDSNETNDSDEETNENQKEAHDLEELLDETFFDDEYKIGTNVYSCEICFQDFYDCLEYLDHQESHDGNPVFKCSKCSEVFSTRKELVQHDSNHRSPCEQCGKMISKSSMKLHLVRHTDKYKCKECAGRFNSRAGLTQHIITVHTDIKDHICETCGKRFSSQTAMRVHMKSHSDERMYPCKQCAYAGRTASALYIHMSTHANDLCVCEVCSKTFKSTRNLNDHLRRVHCKNKKHECTYCLKRFVDRYILRVHMRCHTGVRPYKCTKCDKSFIRSDGLKEHMMTHGQREYFDCLECGKRFTSKRGVARHACTGVL